jgi:hypothetical protein
MGNGKTDGKATAAVHAPTNLQGLFFHACEAHEVSWFAIRKFWPEC